MIYPYLRGRMMTFGTVLFGLLLTAAGGDGIVTLLTPQIPDTQSVGALASSAPVTVIEQTATSSNIRSMPAGQEAGPLLIMAPNPECPCCYMEAATSSGTSKTAAAIIFSAYSITSAYLSDGVCITTSGVPVVLTEAHTITSPSTISISDFNSYIGSEFRDFLGFSACVGARLQVNATPLVTVEAVTSVSLPITADSTTSLLPAPSVSLPATANSTTSPTPHSSSATNPIATPRLDKPTKIGIGIGISLAAILLISFVAVIWRKRRRRSAATTTGDQDNTKNRKDKTSASLGDGQLYLQQKPELEAEEQQIYELDAWQEMCELDGENGINEISAGTYEHRLAVMRSRQELTGGEHGQELDS